jgi:hypothetical protein
MDSKPHTTLSRIWMLALLSNGLAFAQPAGAPRGASTVAAAPAAPTITILTAAAGALVLSQGAGNASIDLGHVSYFKGTSAPGESIRKNSRSFVVSTRFGLKVDCPGSLASSKVNVSMSRLDAAASHAIVIDGTTLGPAAQSLVQSMPCGSGGEHRLDVEVPVSTPAGSIGSTVAFLATLSR